MKKQKPKVGRPKSDTPRRAPLYVRNDFHAPTKALAARRGKRVCELIEGFLAAEFKSEGIFVA